MPTPIFSSTEKLSRRFIYYLLILANVLSNEMEVKNMIRDIFFQVFPNLAEKDFSWDKEQKDYSNWDSFAQLNLITLTETKFNITLSLEESLDIKSANDLLQRVKAHLK
jgi:acyl carrier protein